MFEGVQNHVLDLLRKGKFGPFYFSSKFMITCQMASLVHFQIVRKGKFGPDSEKKDSKQVQHVILNSFKHFSGPKYKTLGTLIVAVTLFRPKYEIIENFENRKNFIIC